MSEYILIDVSKHDEENRKTIRDLLEQRCGFVVPRCTVKDTGKRNISKRNKYDEKTGGVIYEVLFEVLYE